MQPVARRPIAFSWGLICFVIAAVMFLIAAFVALGDVTAKWEAALVPGGLFFFVLGHLLP